MFDKTKDGCPTAWLWATLTPKAIRRDPPGFLLEKIKRRFGKRQRVRLECGQLVHRVAAVHTEPVGDCGQASYPHGGTSMLCELMNSGIGQHRI